MPVGPGLLGRVVDPLGRPLDAARRSPPRRCPVERRRPAIIDRALVTEPVQTGILVIDALFALGRGQRELIIGDRATGKTAIAIDTIINQKRPRHGLRLCRRRPEIRGRRARHRRRAGAWARRSAACSWWRRRRARRGLQWIAPFAGITIAEYFRDAGGHALIVLDDLTNHAATHREIALLTHQPPGREAYPGDVFYLHARLLERAAKLSPRTAAAR